MKGGEIMKVGPLIVVIIFITFDIGTGWLKALSTGTADSSVMRKGLFHKLAEILAVLFGYTCELVFPLVDIKTSIPLAAGIATYIVIMETASIVENLAIMNPALADILSKFFSKEKLNPEEKGEQTDENKSGSSS